jgi:hypothetical protein
MTFVILMRVGDSDSVLDGNGFSLEVFDVASKSVG